MSNRIIMAAAGVSTGISTQTFVSRLESTTAGAFTSPSIAVNPTTKEVYLAWATNVSKFNANGTLAWQRTLTYAANNFNIKGICVLQNNNVVVIADGNTSSIAGVIRLNPDGTLINAFLYQTGIDVLIAEKTVAISDGSYLTLYENGGGTFPSYATISKYSSANAHQWTANVREATDTISYTSVDASVDPSGSIYMLVSKAVTSYVIVKINSDGSIAWQRSFSGYSGLVRGIGSSSDSVYIFGNDQTNGRFNLTKLVGSTGAVSWERSITVSGTRIPGPATVGPDGAIYCVGTLNTAGIGVEDIVVYKFDASGTSVWQRAFGTAADDGTGNPNGLAFDGLGNYYICGDAATNSRVYVARLPTDGTLTGTYTPFTYSSVTHTVSTTTTVTTATSTELYSSSTTSLGTFAPTVTTPTTSFTATRTLL